MTNMRDWLASESAKRLRHWDRAEQWRVLQQTIAWAEQQATVRRNTPAACLREQQRKISRMRTESSVHGMDGMESRSDAREVSPAGHADGMVVTRDAAELQ